MPQTVNLVDGGSNPLVHPKGIVYVVHAASLIYLRLGFNS